jgi:hypothetical protein
MLLFAGSAAQAQIPLDTFDWAADRGNVAFFGAAPAQNAVSNRLGYNNFVVGGLNDPGPAVGRWNFPATRDIQGTLAAPGTPPTNMVADNPNGADPIQPRNRPTLSAPLRAPSVEFAGAWTIPLPDNRAPGGGFSFDTDPSQPYNFDYAFVPAVHDDFVVDRAQGADTPATRAELAALPNATPAVYRAVHNRLVNSSEPVARFSSGTLAPGRYAIELFSPGDGTLVPNAQNVLQPRPVVSRALVRVSWRNTVNGDGSFNLAGINDPVNSRIFLVNLGRSGWIRLADGQGNSAEFSSLVTYTGNVPQNPQDQLVVSIYSVTPDNLTGGVFVNPPIVTADAVRFIPQAFSANPRLGDIAAAGRILGPAVSTGKIAGVPDPLNAQPLFYFAREESVPEISLPQSAWRSRTDPTDPNSPIAPDPTGTATRPVFYCIDNRRGDTLLGPNNPIPSIDKVRWRFIGVPEGSSGTASASALIANVRCRDGNARSMIFFVTTTTDGGLGRIYALDPVGNPANRETTAYWTYPSIRPLLDNVSVDQFPPQFNDPNYRRGGNVPPIQAAYNTLPSFGPDQGVNTPQPGGQLVFYYDGDLTQNPTNQNNTIVRTDTRITLGGLQSAPMIIDDPANAAGAQLLIVGDMNGRIFALDAGGRGDFGTVANTASPSGNTVVAGTTQRIWTWPRFGADAFRHVYPTAAQQDTQTNNFTNEPGRVAFPSTPSYDAVTNRIIVGAADGRLYGIQSVRDIFRSAVNNTPSWEERVAFRYPGGDATLGAALSTAAIYQPGGGDRFAYFTSAGRVYSVNITQLPGGTAPVTATLSWVFPPSSNPPQPDPNNPATTPLQPGFGGSAPVLVNLLFNGVNRDLCVVLQSNGTVRALDAVGGNGTTTQLAAGGSEARNFTRCTPILTLLRSQPDLLTSTASQPAIVFADDSGGIHGVGLTPIQGASGNLDLLPLLWRWQDANGPRSASAIMSNGTIVQGDESGQMRAYSFGLGPDGTIPSLGPGEPLPAVPGNGSVTIDLRGLDIYDDASYRQFMLSPDNAGNRNQARTPAPGFATTANPLPGNVAPGSNAYAFDWGDFIEVAAWGVYHAKPPLQAGVTQPGWSYGTNRPQIRVTFNITQPNVSGRGNRPPTVVTVPAVSPEGAPFWPNDLGIPAGTAFTIFGTDPTNPQGAPGPLSGNASGVYPWVAVVRVPRNGIHVRPDATSPFTPGALGLRITATAQIEQQIATLPMDPMQQPQTTQAQDVSATLALGQRDTQGKSNSLNQANVNQPNVLGPERQLFIAHPFAVTIRGHNGQVNLTQQPNVVGWGPDLAFIPQPGRGEILANGNRVVDPISGNALLKSLFAPINMIPDGTSAQYAVVNPGTGERLPALFVMDRSNLARTTGTRLGIKAHTRAMRWHGDWTSVMNPLPWERMPNDAQDTPDYPNIPPENLQLTSNNQNLVDAPEEDPPALIPPEYPVPDPRRRTTLPTPLDMTVRVPLYQPANVNFGFVGGQRPFGSGYRDISGRMRGGDGIADPIVGPLSGSTGLPVPVANNVVPSFPAGGYVSDVIIRAAVRGVAVPPFSGQAIYDDFRLPQLAGVNSPPQAYRGFELGLTVPPRTRMRIAEQTIDLGRLPHGAGYSDIASGNFSAPFAPSGSLLWPTGQSPWDSFFRPFTLINESNINLVAVRLAKLIAPVNAINGSTLLAGSARLGSDQINNLTGLPLFAIGFAGAGVGNIGLVSSFDHVSNSSGFYREYPLWPLPNPNVTAEGIAAAGLNVPAPNRPVWNPGVQPHPTVHKPLVGDAQGVVATVPDVPHNFNANDFPGFVPNKPVLSMAIPLGTPSGTYAGNIFAFEDNTPFQWRSWLELSRGQSLNNVLADRDGVLNTNIQNGQPLEPFTDPTFNLRVTVVESRLTEGITPGSLSQIDLPFLSVGTPDQWQFSPAGGDMLPAAIKVPDANPANQRIALYWATNRQPANSPFSNANGLPMANSPWSLAFSTLPTPSGDSNFFRPGAVGTANAAWWSAPTLFKGLVGNAPATTEYLFPSTINEARNAAFGGVIPPYQPGTRALQTERHASPATALAINPANFNDPEAYLVWTGSIDKVRVSGDQQFQQTETRTFYTALANGLPTGQTLSFLNDPALPKLSPKPLVLKLGTQKFFYLFWHAGQRSQTRLFYNVNAVNGLNNAFLPNGWSEDMEVPTPSALSWQSDPYPIYRRAVSVYNPVTRQATIVNDVIDIVYTGVLKNRQRVELLLSRFRIRRGLPGETGPLGSLELMSASTAWQEVMTRDGRTNLYTARDAGWFTTGDRNGLIRIELLRPGDVNPILLNRRQDGSIQRGRYDEASGLIYFDSSLGGQIVVDANSGTVFFPSVAPGQKDAVLVSYVPQVMRLNTTRDSATLDRSVANPYGNFSRNDPVLQPKGAIDTIGNHSGPVAILDRAPNPRAALTAPQVVFGNGTPTTDRLWLLYRKVDSGPKGGTGIYYKTMRLMVRLPRPVGLTARDANGNQQLRPVTITPVDGAGALRGPYEVDWVRGRIYFTEVDEGRVIQVNYQGVQNNGSFASGNLTYIVAWGDELDAGTEPNPLFSLYQTTPEREMPSRATVSEGQIAAFKDPIADKLWVFWSSTRGANADLFYQTLSPQFYPIATNQR